MQKMLACLVAAASMLMLPVDAMPRFKRDVTPSALASTTYGQVEGKTYSISDDVDLDVFLGIPYAQPPVGDFRLARPKPIVAWNPWTLEAKSHGAQCKGRIIVEDPVLAGVPYSEDCLFLDIYTTRLSGSEGQPVMVYIHPGGFYGGTGAKYNYTNLALKGVVVVTINYRLDVLGFLSTEDDVIPGNYGLLDAALALDFIKEIIGSFGGNPEDITLFGASAGSAMVSIMTLSPLTKDKFQKAIMQSGPALAPWSVYPEGRELYAPKDLAHMLGQRLNCSLPANSSHTDFSSDLLTCLRLVDVDTLLAESLTIQIMAQAQIFSPVSKDAFGFLPDTIEAMLSQQDQLASISTMWGYSTDDGSWVVPDPEDDGLTYGEFQVALMSLLAIGYPQTEIPEVTLRVSEAYNLQNATQLSSLELRDLAITIATDATMAAFAVKQARLFSNSEGFSTAKTFVYEFSHRPSYSEAPDWQGVGHSDEKGFVLGLPEGPDPFAYPSTTEEDEEVSDLVTEMWSNFAMYGDPTPQAIGGVRWPEFGHSTDDQDILVIQPQLEVKRFDRDEAVVAWTGDSGILTSDPDRNPSSGSQFKISLYIIIFEIGLSFVITNF